MNRSREIAAGTASIGGWADRSAASIFWIARAFLDFRRIVLITKYGSDTGNVRSAITPMINLLRFNLFNGG